MSNNPVGYLNPPQHRVNSEPVVQAWMNPLNKLIWRKAFKARATSVTINDGRKFTLDYTKRKGFVLVKPADGALVPMGWFDLKRVASLEWIS